MKRLFIFVIMLALFALYSCPALSVKPETTITQTPTPGLKLMQMITIEDVVIQTFSLHAEGNVGGIISKGTPVLVECDEHICKFPDSLLYIPRSSVEPYISIRPPVDEQT